MKAVTLAVRERPPIAAWVDARKSWGKGARTRRALDGFSLDLPPSSILGLAGLNGAGKTTALKALLGLVALDSGGIQREDALTRPGAVGYVPEDSSHPPLLSCLEVVQAHASLVGRGREQAAAALSRAGLGDTLHLATRALSKGMARRLSLASALVTSPSLLVLDEPQSGLDPVGRRDLGLILEELRSQGCAVLIASHDLAEIERWCDRVAIVHGGRVVDELAPGSDAPSLLERFFQRIETATGEAEGRRI